MLPKCAPNMMSVSLTLSGPGFFDQPQPGGTNHPPYLKFDPLELEP